ncbi:MAG TPA: hypothetical protein VNJ54_00610 [Plantibacter sp.]|uniref:hypothetical protein n=1 Tax=unclassified Plantibacter TaxID=2624265 RepID=UPI002C384621|nr:hypothetical protein [Plantibacter sp.]
MSGATAALDLAPDRFGRAKPRPERLAPERRHIRAVLPGALAKTRPRPLYAVIVVGAVIAIVSGQLLLSVGLSQGAYQIQQLEGQQVELGRTSAALAEDLDRLASPQYLAVNAQALGMVGNSLPSYLRLSDGAVLGTPTPAAASTSPIFGATLVPNAQTATIPLVGGQNPAAADGASSPDAGTTPVPLQDGLPSPTTR